MFKPIVLGVAVLLFSLSVLAVGCGSASPSVQVSSFGGPYPYQGGIQKIAEFQWYKDHLNDLSEQMPLTENRLSRSISNNRAKNVTGIELQKYNYVIPERGGKIYVGVWKHDITWATEEDWIHPGIVQKRDETCTNLTTDSSAPLEAKMGAMIDFYSEEPEINFHAGITRQPPRASPCWLQVAKDEKKAGILDAMTKHFMLVQVDQTLQDFDLAALASWPSKEVAYAGELFVLISNKTCRVIINNGSGTYKPDAGNDRGSLKHLKAVAERFSSQGIDIYAVTNEKGLFRTFGESYGKEASG